MQKEQDLAGFTGADCLCLLDLGRSLQHDGCGLH